MPDNKLAADQFERIDFPGGIFRRANAKRFKALHGLAVQRLDLKPGAGREPHSHPNAEQLDYCIACSSPGRDNPRLVTRFSGFVRPRLLPLAAIFCAACGGSSSDTSNTQPTRMAVVQSNDQKAADTVQSRMKQLNGELVGVLPQSGAQIWKLPAAVTASDIDAIKRDAPLNHVEFSPQGVTPAIPAQSVALDALSGDQRGRVQELTKGLRASDFRISESRPQLLSLDLLEFASKTALQPSGRRDLSLTLLSESPVLFAEQRVDRRTSSDFSWVGVAEGQPGDALLVVSPEGITGRVVLGRDVFSLLPVGGGRQLIRRVNQATFPPDHPPGRDSGSLPRASAARADVPSVTCSPANEGIDILGAYTSSVTKTLADPGALLRLAVDQANRASQNSKVPVTFRLVGTREWEFKDTGDFDADLAAIRDGKVKTVFQSRDDTAADVVMTLTTNGAYCGLAADIPAVAATGFGLVNHTCAVDNISFVHEAGHLFGARHDVDPTETPHKYGHGYALKNEWRTIMAYPGKCDCPRIEWWSNPNMTRADSSGVQRPMGTAASNDNARVLTETYKALAGFRCQSQ